MAALINKKAPIFEAKFNEKLYEVLGFVRIPFIRVEHDHVEFKYEQEALAMQCVMAKKFNEPTNTIKNEMGNYECRLCTEMRQFVRAHNGLIRIDIVNRPFEIIEI